MIDEIDVVAESLSAGAQTRARGCCTACGHRAALERGRVVGHAVRRVKIINGEPHQYRSEHADDRVCAGSGKLPEPLRYYIQPKGR